MRKGLSDVRIRKYVYSIALSSQDNQQVQEVCELLNYELTTFSGESDFCRLAELNGPCLILLGDVENPDALVKLLASWSVKNLVVFRGLEAQAEQLINCAGGSGLNVLSIVSTPATSANLKFIFLSAFSGAEGYRQEQDLANADSAVQLAAALDEKHIFAVLQPKIRAHTGTLTGFEALARWLHPTMGLVGPNVFLTENLAPVNLRRLTVAVARDAISWLAKLRSLGNISGPGVRSLRLANISLNIAIQSLEDRSLFNELAALCREHGVETDSICLHFKAEDILGCGAQCHGSLQALKNLGFILALDQFSPAQSQRLTSQPLVAVFSEVVFDKRAVMTAGQSGSASSALAEAAADLNPFGMQLTAIGVSDNEALQLLEKIGISQGQGYFISAPMLPENTMTWFKRREAHREMERLDALHAMGLLDTPQEERFDRWTALARRLFDTPTALISLIDKERQWFKAGIEEDEETGRDLSICSVAIEADNQLVVQDASEDLYLCTHPAVTKIDGVRFYAGQPLIMKSGHKIGTFCLADGEPRLFSAGDRRVLAALSVIALEEIESALKSPGHPVGRLERIDAESATALAFRELWRELSQPVVVTSFRIDDAKPVPESLLTVAETSDFSGIYAQDVLVCFFVARAADDLDAILSSCKPWFEPSSNIVVDPGDLRPLRRILDDCVAEV